jgi:lipopolysaccharide transport system ATP-binding protein
MSSDIAIKVEQLGKCYRVYRKAYQRLLQLAFNGRKKFYRESWAIRHASFELKKGETLGVIGKNGSGKSNLLQMIAGTLAQTEGDISAHGRVTALLELGSGFNPEFSGRDNVYINALIYGVGKKEIAEKFSEIEQFADIGEYIDQPVKFYSSGMIMRLAFSVSVFLTPDILVIDEALAVGDAAFQFKCLNRLLTLSEQGCSILFVSHDMNLIKNFCDRALYIRKGHAPQLGATDEMVERYLLEMRETQQSASSGAQATGRKKETLPGGRMVYGNHEGRIVSARFVDQGEGLAVYAHGAPITLRLAAAFLPQVRQPSLSITIQDRKLIVLGGYNFPLQAEPAQPDMFSASIDVRFAAKLAGGRYYISLKLFDGLDESIARLIEKQVACLEFEIYNANKKFLGMIDFGMEEISEADVSQHLCIKAMGSGE